MLGNFMKNRLTIALLVCLLSAVSLQNGLRAQDMQATEPATAQATVQTTDASGGQPAGTTRTDARGIDQVWVPAGCFKMGSDDPAGYAGLDAPTWAKAVRTYEQPAHEACLTSSYWIDKYEVTNAAYNAFVDDGGYQKQEY